MNKLIASMLIGILLGVIIPLTLLLFSNVQNKPPYTFKASKNTSVSATSATVTAETAGVLSTTIPAFKTTNTLSILLIIAVSLIVSSIVSLYIKKSLEISKKKDNSKS
ncbi:MAG: hypothetical protein ACP5GU_03580 [Thermoprotei archaeon]|jgi:beta-lactamase regulating signal transducer with metallopeptidase domain